MPVPGSGEIIDWIITDEVSRLAYENELGESNFRNPSDMSAREWEKASDAVRRHSPEIYQKWLDLVRELRLVCVCKLPWIHDDDGMGRLLKCAGCAELFHEACVRSWREKALGKQFLCHCCSLGPSVPLEELEALIDDFEWKNCVSFVGYDKAGKFALIDAPLTPERTDLLSVYVCAPSHPVAGQFGLRASGSFAEGACVGCYAGLVQPAFACVASDYCFNLSSDSSDRALVVDARHTGNLMRFINHSADPTLRAVVDTVDHLGQPVPIVRIFAARDIAPLEELTLDYGEEYWAKWTAKKS